MARTIEVAPGVVVPDRALRVRAVRASGPGGQNVNKVASKVTLRVELGLIEGLDDGARRRLQALAAGRLDGAGRLVVTSQRTRDQGRNLEDARGKVRALVAQALVRPTPRRPTAPSGGAREDRLREKKRRSAVKRFRGERRVEEAEE
jgi:ribosome-associated protein